MNQRVTYTLSGALAGARQTVPLAISAFAVAVVFGILARQVGLSLLASGLMSALVFAGASQFIAIGLWATPLPVFIIISTTLIVNLRHLLMGAALRSWFSGLSAPKAYSTIFFMTDESWPLAIRDFMAGGRDAAFMLGSGLTLFPCWVGGTVVGRFIGTGIQSKDLATWALDFIFTALFTALLVSMWRGKSDILPWATAVVVALAASRWLPGTWYILLGGIAGSLVGALRDTRSAEPGSQEPQQEPQYVE